MRLTLEVARRNALTERTGGPFGAAIFDEASGQLVAVGMNLVVDSCCSTSHAEIIAIQSAQKALGHYSLRKGGVYSIFSSCEPCAQCLGAVLWSGVCRLVTSATGVDARGIGFDEGPVFPESYTYLQERGLSWTPKLLVNEGRKILSDYAAQGGIIYNP